MHHVLLAILFVIAIHSCKTGKYIASVYGFKKTSTINDVKLEVQKMKTSMTPQRQEVRLQQKSKGLKETETLEKLNIKSGDKLFVKDLGFQIGWTTVFFCEYAGPFFLYLWINQRPWVFYGEKAWYNPMSLCCRIALICWCGHYAKRLFETKFVHRFSHGTMPIFNLFRNCLYYWGFAAYVAYHVNHPLFTPPSDTQMYLALAGFTFCELGNLSIHVGLRNLRPPGTKERKIPVATGNPFTLLFNFVSCPNYTYEVGSWVFFTIMTQCLPAAIFTFAGLYQMVIWAHGKHRNYLSEFPKYPKNRKSIIPFIL